MENIPNSPVNNVLIYVCVQKDNLVALIQCQFASKSWYLEFLKALFDRKTFHIKDFDETRDGFLTKKLNESDHRLGTCAKKVVLLENSDLQDFLAILVNVCPYIETIQTNIFDKDFCDMLESKLKGGELDSLERVGFDLSLSKVMCNYEKYAQAALRLKQKLNSLVLCNKLGRDISSPTVELLIKELPSFNKLESLQIDHETSKRVLEDKPLLCELKEDLKSLTFVLDQPPDDSLESNNIRDPLHSIPKLIGVSLDLDSDLFKNLVNYFPNLNKLMICENGEQSYLLPRDLLDGLTSVEEISIRNTINVLDLITFFIKKQENVVHRFVLYYTSDYAPSSYIYTIDPLSSTSIRRKTFNKQTGGSSKDLITYEMNPLRLNETAHQILNSSGPYLSELLLRNNKPEKNRYMYETCLAVMLAECRILKSLEMEGFSIICDPDSMIEKSPIVQLILKNCTIYNKTFQKLFTVLPLLKRLELVDLRYISDGSILKSKPLNIINMSSTCLDYFLFERTEVAEDCTLFLKWAQTQDEPTMKQPLAVHEKEEYYRCVDNGVMEKCSDVENIFSPESNSVCIEIKCAEFPKECHIRWGNKSTCYPEKK